jgi:lysophospholipase L1-like esterase
MGLKKLIIMILLIALPIVIYLTNQDKKIYYISLGDSLARGETPYGSIGYGFSDYISLYLKNKKELEFYTKDYAGNGYHTTDLVKDINHNRKIDIDGKPLTIKNALTKADVVTLAIGANDLFYKLGIHSADFVLVEENELKKYVNEVMNDMEDLIILIKKYCKEDLIVVGYYNPLWQRQSSYSKEIEPVFIYANDKMRALAKKYDFYYIDVYKMFKDNDSYLPNPVDVHPSSSGYNAIASKIINIINKNVLN